MPQPYRFSNLRLNHGALTAALVDSAKCLWNTLGLLKFVQVSSGIHANEILFIYLLTLNKKCLYAELMDVFNGCFQVFFLNFSHSWTYNPQKSIIQF